MMMPTPDLRRRIPPLDRLLQAPGVERLTELYGRDQVRIQARRQLDALRRRLAAGGSEADLASGVETFAVELARNLERRLGRGLRRVINATGVFLHTNLGRAPLPREVATSLPELLDASCDLEIDLETGRRGDRNRRASELLKALTGAEGAVVTNNCAAAMVLVLATFARGREVIVSRGELVEIGGSFRIPAILEASGARLREVGSTNRTRLADYEGAIGPDTGLLLKVFPSNYRMVGFVEEVSPAALAELARSRGIPFLVDEGSGLPRPHQAPQLADHPSLQELVGAGCDLVCGSGDKVLGGPQAGLLVGRGDLIDACRKHPLYRALRPDRVAFASLEAVLRLHLAGAELPLNRLWPQTEDHERRLAAVAQRLGAARVAADAFVGGGSAPEAGIPGTALALPGNDALLRRLRLGEPSVVGYLREGHLLLDLRTVDPADDDALCAAVEAARDPAGAPLGDASS